MFDIPVGPTRRAYFQKACRHGRPQPRTLVAITAANVDPVLLQALALAIDRAPIVNVLAQHKGEAAFGLLPQWLSGYAFLFQSTPDVRRAKQLVSQLRLGPISLSYPANDSVLRIVAERVALNARDAGIAIQPTSNAGGNLRLMEWSLESTDAATELARIAERWASAIGQPYRCKPSPKLCTKLERSLLDEHRIIPLVHLRETYGIAPRVHFQSSTSDTFASASGRCLGTAVSFRTKVFLSITAATVVLPCGLSRRWFRR